MALRFRAGGARLSAHAEVTIQLGDGQYTTNISLEARTSRSGPWADCGGWKAGSDGVDRRVMHLGQSALVQFANELGRSLSLE